MTTEDRDRVYRDEMISFNNKLAVLSDKVSVGVGVLKTLAFLFAIFVAMAAWGLTGVSSAKTDIALTTQSIGSIEKDLVQFKTDINSNLAEFETKMNGQFKSVKAQATWNKKEVLEAK